MPEQSRPRIPRITSRPTADELRRMPLTPTDGFVLSRVDGMATEEEIIGLTGLPAAQVTSSLEHLVQLALVAFEGEAGNGAAANASAIEPPRAAAPSPASEKTETSSGNAALTDEERQRILDFFAKLDVLDHYALLGVQRAAEKKEIKRAYFERAAIYHPDRYFRRNVGDLKAKLETIFARVTAAHDVLTDKLQRGEYDAYLGALAHTRELEARLKQGEERVREAEVAASAEPNRSPSPLPESGRAVESVKAPDSGQAAQSSGRIPAAAPSGVMTGPGGEPRRASKPMVAIDPQARRDLLAKHLRGGRSLTPARMPAVPVSPTPDPEALRRMYEQRKQDRSRAQAAKQKQVGDAALAAGDPITAASAYQAALRFSPNDAQLQRLYTEASAVSETTLAETYRSQALYEEKAGRWPDAVKSWAKIARLLPNDAATHERAANAILQAGGNLHDAASFALKAIGLAPQNPQYRKLLASIYLEAGLFKNAKRELEGAQQLAPQDDSIAALAKRLATAMAQDPNR